MFVIVQYKKRKSSEIPPPSCPTLFGQPEGSEAIDTRGWFIAGEERKIPAGASVRFLCGNCRIAYHWEPGAQACCTDVVARPRAADLKEAFFSQRDALLFGRALRPVALYEHTSRDPTISKRITVYPSEVPAWEDLGRLARTQPDACISYDVCLLKS